MKKHLHILLWVVLLNYLAQIPYAIHLYHNLAKTNLSGAALLGLTFLLFLVSYLLLIRNKVMGYIGMIAFLSIEFLFYLGNFISSILHGYAPFFQLANPDPILWVVFFIGYVNFIATGYFLYYLLRHQKMGGNYKK